MAGGKGVVRSLLDGPGGRPVYHHGAAMMRKIWVHPENSHVRMRRLAGWVGWQLWERTVATPRVVRLHDGVRLVCHPHDQVASMALYYGLYDSQEMRFLLAWLRPDDTFVDVGANVAPYSLLAAAVAGARAIAFEPETVARGRAADNISLNGVQDRVQLLPVAVSDVDGTGLVSADRSARNSLVDDDYGGIVERVDTVRLDTFVDRAPIGRVGLVKIDVEGREPEVLRGATAVIARDRPALIVECNDAVALDRYASDHDYQRVEFSPRTGALTAVASPAVEGTNAILVPDFDEARARVQQPTGTPHAARR